MTMQQILETKAPAVSLFDAEINFLKPGLMVADHAALDGLVKQMKILRSQLSPNEWKEFCQGFKQQYADVWSLVSSCPMTAHAAARPRGYPGDAELIDFLYSVNPGRGISGTAAEVFRYTSDSPSAKAVRNRKGVLAQYIDAIPAGGGVISLACGHAREVMESAAIQAGRVKFLGMDQDEASIAEVNRACAGMKVEARKGTVREWLKGRYENLSGFDLGYACGLYDYLDDAVGAALTARMFNVLRPGGKLIVPNFLKDISGVGYMECCMDWWLIYRDEADMLRLLSDIPAEQIAGTRIFTEPAQNIIFLEVQKA